MKTILRILAMLGLPALALAQMNTLSTTTLASAITGSQTTIFLASTSNLVAPSFGNGPFTGAQGVAGSALFTQCGELMQVLSFASGGTAVQVQRGVAGTPAVGCAASTNVWIGNPDWFSQKPLGTIDIGTCTLANLYSYPKILIYSNIWEACDSTGSWTYGGPIYSDPRIPAARTTVADAAYTALPYDSIIAYTSLTTGRTVTLPVATQFPGKVYTIVDETGVANTDNITIAAASGTFHCTATLSTAYGTVRCRSNGTGWYNY